MDMNLWGPIIVAFIAAVPGAIALFNQARKDKQDADKVKRDQDISMNNDARNAAMAMLKPLQDEVARLQARVAELEQALIDKTSQIGQLMMEGIDKDAKYRSLQSTVTEMQLKLSAFEVKKETTQERKAVIEHKQKLMDESNSDDIRKEEIAKQTQTEIEKLTNGSILNGSMTAKETS